MSESEPPKGDRRVRAKRVAEVADDMLEVRADGAPPYVVRFVTALEEHPNRPLLSLFASFDDDAKSLQQRHIGKSRAGIITGTLALVLGISQLAFHPDDKYLIWLVEPVLIVLTLVLVLPGIVSNRHHRWMLARYNAEQLRLLKWRLLTDPLLPTLSPHDLEARIHDEIDTTLVPDIPMMEDRARRESPIAVPRDVPDLPARELRGLLDHYCDNRLAAQSAYFLRKAGDDDRTPSISPTLVPVVFLASMALVLLHMSFDLAARLTNSPLRQTHESISLIFLFLATIVPAGWAGVRTWRATVEVSRNAMRAAAKHDALAAYQARLRIPDIRASEAFGILACCEGLFAQEQGEWLRLMTEAESYT